MSQSHHHVLALALVKILHKLPVFIQSQLLMLRLLFQEKEMIDFNLDFFRRKKSFLIMHFRLTNNSHIIRLSITNY